MIQLNALWLRILLTIGVGFTISFAATPIVKSFAQKVGAIDVPRDARRVHRFMLSEKQDSAQRIGTLKKQLRPDASAIRPQHA